MAASAICRRSFVFASADYLKRKIKKQVNDGYFIYGFPINQ